MLILCHCNGHMIITRSNTVYSKIDGVLIVLNIIIRFLNCICTNIQDRRICLQLCIGITICRAALDQIGVIDLSTFIYFESDIGHDSAI